MSVFEEEEIKWQPSHLIIQLLEQSVRESSWKGERNNYFSGQLWGRYFLGKCLP